MFRRLWNNLPKDPSYPADLTKLGYTLNAAGQFVKVSNPNELFQYHVTDNDRANEVHKEAMHECVRHTVLTELTALGVKEVYVHEDGVVDVKPEGPHIGILATELAELKEKRDVVVVAGESMQDLGIWAYRALMWEPGLEGGSAVGLIRRLRAYDPDAAQKAVHPGLLTAVANGLSKLKLDGTTQSKPTSQLSPGLVILNPGQLLYSYDLNKSMSQSTWLARPKPSALDDDIRIDPLHNRVPGHETPEKHIATVLEHILPRLTRKDARLYIVGISEGGEAVLKYVNAKLATNPDDEIGLKLEAIALCQPTHHAIGDVTTPALKTFLGARAKSWVLDEAPKGKLLAVPGGLAPIVHYADSAAQSRLLEDQEEDLEASNPTPFAVAPSTSEGRNVDCDYERSAYDPPRPTTTALQQSASSITTKEPGDSIGDLLEKSEQTLAKGQSEGDDENEPNPYAQDDVSCPTFSSGVEGVAEMIWPAVMGDVLEWFKRVAEESDVVARSL